MKKLILSCIFLSIMYTLFAYNDLRVGDPRNSWYTYQGTIEEASLSVRPKGLCMEYGLYLTVSSRGTVLNKATDSLEVTLNFELPAGAIVHDSWLWIGDTIARAKILDKWTASSIYEGIVKRRKDPSILTKEGANQYRLKIFPMVGNKTRKVKITYLMPADFQRNTVSASLPIPILKTSKNTIYKLQVYTWADSVWKNPSITNDNTLLFQAKTDTTFGNYYSVYVPTTTGVDYKIGFDNPSNNGFFFSKFQTGDEGFYQIALFPDQYFLSKLSKKVTVLIDYDSSNSTTTSTELFNTLKSEMLNGLNATDSFNIIVSNLDIVRYSNTWKLATPSNITDAIETMKSKISTYSNLPSLLNDGVDFIKKNGNDGKIILLSNSDNQSESVQANNIIKDLIGIMNPKIQINIADYQSQSFPWVSINGLSYCGNDYFYLNLSNLTTGSYSRLYNGKSLSLIINEAFGNCNGIINSFDFYTRLTSGVCHSKYLQYQIGSTIYSNKPILQVGRFKGDFPFLIQLTGEFNGELFDKTITINDDEAFKNDSTTEEMWTGMNIRTLELGTINNSVIAEIIKKSMSQRVLSLYTSFLCLEDTAQYCPDCQDESKLYTDVKDVKDDINLIKLYPSPFVDLLTIEIDCKEPSQVIELAIYDVTGSKIYQFNCSGFVKGKNTLKWDGKTTNGSTIKTGIYFLCYKTYAGTKTIKLIKK